MRQAVWVAGAMAALSLVACIVLAIWVFMGGPDPSVYEPRMSVYKTGLNVATVVYFAAGIYYATQREKARPQD